MRFTLTILIAIFVALFASLTSAHLCLYDPAQRGAAVPTPLGPGDNNCYKVASNCGNMTSGASVATYYSGTAIPVTFQQNYNHWYPTNMGYMDVAISYTGDNGPYTTLNQLDDFNAWDMVAQTNFTVSSQLPSTKGAAVLRVRYVSNNAGEPYTTFYQCSDITVI
ncbi:hypothetical protein DFA_11381 [Cavenderia fasciculata]|uniref:Chitin-binding type-4 domain-containing protein n=1 Tax=Cavenderia fasciculata TaxID=261658 RepID=F4QCN8_CACFS|nr:uncharacterized protein DFA_11381 [Cavenderia fasciculata]EGG13620.1 hypothetical protein DFA_11381 [Cavenderia fasciculata]|eukprot:XP_004350324.1 hypothetical protein DFA_11381 [Cavenderia fasciculata]